MLQRLKNPENLNGVTGMVGELTPSTVTTEPVKKSNDYYDAVNSLYDPFPDYGTDLDNSIEEEKKQIPPPEATSHMAREGNHPSLLRDSTSQIGLSSSWQSSWKSSREVAARAGTGRRCRGC